MSNEETLSRKDMKSPDKFQEVAKGAIDWISGHKRNAEIVVGLLLAVVLVVGAILLFSGSRSDKSGALVYEVLRNAGAEISSVPLPGVPGPFFATDAERQKAVISAADLELAEYPSSAAGRLALLMKADAQLKLGDAAAALATYQQYLSEAPAGGSLRFGALEGTAIAQESLGKLDDAAAAWEREGREVTIFADHADLERARVLAAAGKGEEARKLLEGFAEKHKGSTYVADASLQLARLGAK